MDGGHCQVILENILLDERSIAMASMAIQDTLSLFEFITHDTKCMCNLNDPEKRFYRLSPSGLTPACLSFDLVQQIQVRLDTD